jgi:hypothetical protein
VKYALPFNYPITPLLRKHGPQGYSKYAQHRPWLRDEFNFRCVYCLKREQWCSQLNDFELDHQVAQSIAADLCREYTNLVYACHNCNHRKGNKGLPSPDKVAYGACMEVLESGLIIPCNEHGERLIDELALDGAKITGWRCRIIQTIRLTQQHDWKLFLAWMGFPDDVPDLATIRPQPKHNTRPEGIEQSWFRRKPLPDYYE